MSKLDYALKLIANCDLCNGKGYQYWGNGDEYEAESCVCNVYDLILDDENGDVIWDNGLLSEPELFTSREAL